MKLQAKDFAVIAAGVGIVGGAYFSWGWRGVALAVGAGFMWALLHFTRIMLSLKRAAARPKGWVTSAVVLQSRLHAGMTMLQVVQLTGALGECVSALDAATQVEAWRWTDEGADSVLVSFERGKVRGVELQRSGHASQAVDQGSPLPSA